MAAENRTSAARTRKLDRQVKALELRRMGNGYAEIARQLGIGKSQAHRLVQDGLADARAQISAGADDLRAEEISRLDGMLAGLWPDARRGSQGAVDRVLKIMERRARLLGLDAPMRLAHAGDPDGPPVKAELVHTLSDNDLEEIAKGRRPS
jgi:hypothetical protein